jgi:predicted  nucleic acid-binding Zn-ribbon protein
MARTKAIAEELPYELDCLQCGHHWTRRETELPQICPKCKRRTWNEAPKKDPGDPEQMTAPERRAAGNLVTLMRTGQPERVRALLKLIESLAAGE